MRHQTMLVTLATGNTGSTPSGHTWSGASDRQLIILGIVVVVVGGLKMVVGGMGSCWEL